MEPQVNEVSKALPFLAVGRVKDAVRLASYSTVDEHLSEQREQTEDIFKKLLAAARHKLKPGQRTRLQWNDGSVCCLMDQSGALLFCVVTAFMEYPERYAYQLLRDFMAVVHAASDFESVVENGLTVELLPKMQELLTKFGDPTNFDQVLERVSTVKPGAPQEPLRSTRRPGESVREYDTGGWVRVNLKRKIKMYAYLAGVATVVFFLFLWLCGAFKKKIPTEQIMTV